MTPEQIEEYLSDLTDDELRSETQRCAADLNEAATNAPDSERHSDCFAALVYFSQEMNKRGLKLVETH